MSVRHIWICGLLLAALSGCSTFRYQSPELVNDPKLAARLYTALDNRIPPVLQSSQRIVLSTGIREWDFQGFLEYFPDGEFRATLYPEMGGGKVLDIYHEQTSVTRILWSVPRFPKEIVQNSVAGDIKHLFDLYPFELCRAARHSDGRNALVVQVEPDHTIEYVFDEKDQAVAESFETQKGKLTRHATYDKLADFPKSKINRLTPSRIRLKNIQHNYKLNIQILKMELPDATVSVREKGEERKDQQTANVRQNVRIRPGGRPNNQRGAAPQPVRNQNVRNQADLAESVPQQAAPNSRDLAEQQALLNQQRAIQRRLQALRETNPGLSAPAANPAPVTNPAPVANRVPAATPEAVNPAAQPTYPQPDQALLPDPSAGMLQQQPPAQSPSPRRRSSRFIRTR
jgi:hypothetical protein